MRSPQIAAATLALPLVLTGCDADQPPFGPRIVDVAKVEKRLVPELRDYPARLEAPARVDIVARTNGYLLERTFEDGTEVEQNRILFRLQSDHYENALAAAQAELKKAQISSRRLEKSPPGDAPAGGADERTAAIERARAEVALRQAAVDSAMLELAYTTLRAPIGGRIDAHPTDVGNVVRAGDRLATIVQLDPIGLLVEVDAADVARLREAHRETPLITQVVGDDDRVHEQPGRVRAFGGEIDPQGSTVQLQAMIPNARADLMDGQDATARLLLRWHVDAVVVPQRGIRQEDGETFVLVIDDEDRVEHRPVRTGPVHAGRRVVHEGLAAGERVVVGRARAAIPGRRVRPADKELIYPSPPRLAARLATPAPPPSPTPAATPSPTPAATPSPRLTARLSATSQPQRQADSGKAPDAEKAAP